MPNKMHHGDRTAANHGPSTDEDERFRGKADADHPQGENCNGIRNGDGSGRSEAPAAAETEAEATVPLKMELIPGTGLGPFMLGMPVGMVIEHLHDGYQLFTGVEFVYDQSAKPTGDIVIQLAELGIVLRFAPTCQRLKRIDFWPCDRLQPSYGAHAFDDWEQQGKFQAIHNMFGPCRGEFDNKARSYLLRYPGVTFGFGVPSAQQKLYPGGHIDLTADGKFADGTDPVLSSASIIAGMDLKKAQPPPVSSSWGCSAFYGERVTILQGTGLSFELQKKQMRFGDSCQQLIADFGPPDNVYHRGAVTRVHARTAAETPRSQIFFNYRRFGIDVLFSATECRAVKFVLHTNVPGHYDFNSHSKCNFFVYIDADESAAGLDEPIMASDVIDRQPNAMPPPPVSPTGPGVFLTVDLDADDGVPLDEAIPASTAASSASKKKKKKKKKVAGGGGGTGTSSSSSSSAVPVSDGGSSGGTGSKSSSGSSLGIGVPRSRSLAITPETKWDQALQALGAGLSEPVVLQQPPSTNNANPFGGTHIWNYGNLIFEVMGNSRISTVTLFKEVY